MTPRFEEFSALAPGGFTRLAYAEWGPGAVARTVVCAHGLTRLGRDFDALAAALAREGMRVVAPDMPGRGRSPWLARKEDYSYPFYVAAMAALIARLGVKEVAWVGTSMGGIIGMMLAAQPGTPVTRLVLNDIGAFIPKSALERVAQYIGADPRFDDLDGVEAYLRRVHAPFGQLTDDQWRHLARHSAVPTAAGLRLRYDPAIAQVFADGPLDDMALWPVWDRIACPVLVIRGAESDLLLAGTVAEMGQRGAAAASAMVRTAVIPGCGHAPALMDEDQIALVRGFLAAC
ncbi:MAG: alpha/beta fold hydrolase [Pseudomonadota bacterium]